MTVNHIGGFNPYTPSIGTTPGTIPGTTPGATRTDNTRKETTLPDASHVAGRQPAILNDRLGSGHHVADAIKQNVTERMAQVHSSQAPDGVDQDLWSVLTKDERAFFVKTGVGGLTYGRGAAAEGATGMPIARGGRLDIRV